MQHSSFSGQHRNICPLDMCVVAFLFTLKATYGKKDFFLILKINNKYIPILQTSQVGNDNSVYNIFYPTISALFLFMVFQHFWILVLHRICKTFKMAFYKRNKVIFYLVFMQYLLLCSWHILHYFCSRFVLFLLICLALLFSEI